MDLAARQIQFQALEKAAFDIVLSSRVSRAVLLALILIFIDRICHFWKSFSADSKVLDLVDLESLEMSDDPQEGIGEAAPTAFPPFPRLIGRGPGIAKLSPASC
eukprot:Skav221338  [mRNA]  locus=scaffold1234:216030:220640:+ [translate_table: standard]